MTPDELDRIERQAKRLCANIELIRNLREHLLEIEQNLADTAQVLLLIVETHNDQSETS